MVFFVHYARNVTTFGMCYNINKQIGGGKSKLSLHNKWNNDYYLWLLS